MVERFFLHDGTIKSMQIRSLVFTLANYLYQLPEIFGMNISDIADTESVGLRNLSRTLHQLDIPLLFFVENILDLGKNKHWFETRNHNSSDLVIDTYGNLVNVLKI